MKKDLVIVLAPDSFKESMTAKEVCEAMERGIRKANSQIRCIHVPMADGGEGTMQSLVDATGGRVYSKEVVGPLGNNVVAEYGILGNGDFYINMFRDSVPNELIFSSMIQQDAMIRNLEANGYIGEIEEDKDGEENEN